MCGIVASVSRHRPVAPARISQAVARLRHRGPDAQHAWVAQHGRFGLGHARLSVIDLATGDRAGRGLADALLMWISSVCLLHQTLVGEPRATLVG